MTSRLPPSRPTNGRTWLQSFGHHMYKEFLITKQNWAILLLGILFNVVHAAAHNLAYYLHIPGEPLYDIGFALLPGMKKELQIISEIAFFIFLIVSISFIVSPLINHNKAILATAADNLDHEIIEDMYIPSTSTTNVVTFLSHTLNLSRLSSSKSFQSLSQRLSQFSFDPSVIGSLGSAEMELSPIPHHADDDYSEPRNPVPGRATMASPNNSPYPPPHHLPGPNQLGASRSHRSSLFSPVSLNILDSGPYPPPSPHPTNTMHELDGFETSDFEGAVDDLHGSLDLDSDFGRNQIDSVSPRHAALPYETLISHSFDQAELANVNNNNRYNGYQNRPQQKHSPLNSPHQGTLGYSGSNQINSSLASSQKAPLVHQQFENRSNFAKQVQQKQSGTIGHTPGNYTQYYSDVGGYQTLQWNSKLTGTSAPLYGMQIVTRLACVLCLAQSLRTMCFLMTALPGPNYHCRPFTEVYSPPATWLEILVRSDAFFSCGDLVFSSHTTFMVLFALIYTKYGSIRGLKIAVWTFIGSFCSLVLAARKHYTVDVLIACYTVPLLWAVFDIYCPDEIPLELGRIELEETKKLMEL